eukprot:13572954-Ditylum_brightwellii.AAC.1
MTGCNQCCVTRFERAAKPGFFQVWCGGHQFELVLQSWYTVFGNDKFYRELTSVIGYLYQQQNLISDMKTMCLKLADTYWESMKKFSCWFKTNSVDVYGHLA